MENIYKNLAIQLRKKGVSVIDTDYYDHIINWKEWYSGNVDDFHYYDVTIADGTTVECEKKTMNMAKKCCEDMEKLNWSSKCDIKLGTDEKTKQLWNVLDSKQNNFTIMFPQMLELAFALGTTAMTEYKDTLGRTRIEYINDAMMIIPYAYDNFNITGFVIFNQWQDEEEGKKVYYTHLTYHEFKTEKGRKSKKYTQIYRKYNELYKSDDVNQLGKEISFETMFPDVEPLVEYNTDTPHFQIIKPPIANNLDIETPMGLSIFANSIDKLKAIDNKYDGFDQEYTDCRRKILIDKTALKGSPQVNEDGSITTQLYFDRNDRTFVAVNGMDNQPIKEIAFNIRKDDFVDGINAELNWLGAGVGFGESFYKFDNNKGTATATEILSEDDDAFRTKQNYETMIKDVIIDLVKSVCFLENIQIDENEIQIEFDYSRFENQEKTQQRLEREVSNGITSKVEYRMKVYGETEQVARQKIQEAEEETPSIDKLLNNSDNEENQKEDNNNQKENGNKEQDKEKQNKQQEKE